LNLSRRTIDTHRHNIRKKMGLLNKGVNLRAHLLNLDRDAG
jgi:DNA-binding CsgD family transcriptional regulator